VLPSDAKRVREIGGQLAEIVADWLDFFYQFHAPLGYPGGPVHDPVAFVALTNPEILEFHDVYVQVETAGEYCVGATIGDFYGVSGKAPNTKAILGIDREKYVDLIVDAVRKLSAR
jgi:pyrimidine-specific ribonucleoside hydrolase